MQPLISVIIPVYRVEEYLDRCVESVCSQTYQNLQIILVDDGSDDNCPKMCDDWTGKDSRIQVVHKPNGGLSDARNAGLKVAIGEYVYFLDSDDYIVENAIERMVTVMDERKADAVVFGYTKIGEDGKEISASAFADGTYYFKTEQEKLVFMYKTLLQYRVGWEAWNRLYRMDIIRRNQLKFEPNKEIFAEDRCFNLYYTLCSDNLVCLPDKLHYYLIRSTSIMGKRKEFKVNETIQLSKKVYQLADKLQYEHIKKHFNYIAISLIGILISLIKPEEYAYYAAKVEDKQYVAECCRGLKSQIVFRKIWGVRDGARKRSQYKNFVKKINER